MIDVIEFILSVDLWEMKNEDPLFVFLIGDHPAIRKAGRTICTKL